MKICDFVQPEIDYFLAKCNFTSEEQELFLLRTKDIPLEQCAENMAISNSTVYRINKRVKNKINKCPLSFADGIVKSRTLRSQ